MLDRSTLTLALCLAAAALAFTACGDTRPTQQPDFEAPPIVEPVPEEPRPADEGEAGTFEAADVEPPARQLVVPAIGEGEATAGIVLVHSVWGVDESFRDLARELARHGFVVVAPDLYEGVVSTTRLSHEDLVQGIARERAVDLIRAAVARLDEAPGRPELPEIIVSLRAGAPFAALAASESEDVDGLVIDTGVLPEPAIPDRELGFPTLLLAGERNRSFTPRVRERLQQSFKEAGNTLVLELLPGAGTDLFDDRAMGFSAVARDAAMERLVRYVRERAQAR
jgi:carboxymethylenebutenolidase